MAAAHGAAGGEGRRSSLDMFAGTIGMRRTSQIGADELSTLLQVDDDEVFLNRATGLLEDKHGSASSRTKVTKVSKYETHTFCRIGSCSQVFEHV